MIFTDPAQHYKCNEKAGGTVLPLKIPLRKVGQSNL